MSWILNAVRVTFIAVTTCKDCNGSGMGDHGHCTTCHGSGKVSKVSR